MPIAVAFGVVLAVAMCSDDSGVATNMTTTEVPFGQVGDGGRLVVDSGLVLLAVDEEAYERMRNLSVARDYLGLQVMVQARLLFQVESNTTARIIGRGFERREVRIMDGPQFGRSGWVAHTIVAP